jgi:hypothetical protein
MAACEKPPFKFRISRDTLACEDSTTVTGTKPFPRNITI